MDFIKKFLYLFEDKEQGLAKNAHAEKNETLLFKISKIVVSNLNLEKICQDAVDVFVKQMDYPGAVLLLVNKTEKTIDAYTFSSTKINKFISKRLPMNFREFKYSLDLKDNLIVKTYFTKNEFEDKDGFVNFIKPLCPPKVSRWINKLSRTKIIRSFPIIFGDEVVAIIIVATKNNFFNEKEKEVLRIFSIMLGVAIHNAELYKQISYQVFHLKEKTQDLQFLLDISRIAASSLETQNITQKIVDSVPDKLGHLGYISGIIAMYDPKTTKLSAYSITESEFVQKNVKQLLDKPFNEYYFFANKSHSLIAEVVKTGKIQMDEDVVKFVSPPVRKNIARTSQKLLGMKSCIGLPIFVRGQIMGVFLFLTKKPLNKIDQRDIDLMTAFVNHVGISIDNAMLFDKTIKQLKELEHAKAKLEQTLNMKGEFVHLVSHQLRTPLTVVRGLVSMWYDGDFDKMPEDKQLDFRNRIKSSVERLNNIANQMIKAMEFEGAVTLNFGKVDIVKMVKNTIEFLKPNFDQKDLYLRFENNTGRDSIEIDADANYLTHVFNNMIDNAEKYTKKGGVTVTIGGRGKYVCVKIQDTGVGITEENKERLFKKFSRGTTAVKENPSGSGLGLFIAQQIVKEHHGRISFESEGKNKGTVFTITLPDRQGKA